MRNLLWSFFLGFSACAAALNIFGRLAEPSPVWQSCVTLAFVCMFLGHLLAAVRAG